MMVEHEHKVAMATRNLALLTAQAEGLRTELVRFRRDLNHVQQKLTKTKRELETAKSDLIPARKELSRLQRETANLKRAQPHQLREANEQLVLAALHAGSVAETAVHNLDQLTITSQRDPLTNTPNRALMLDRIESALGSARRSGKHVAILFLDLDYFKRINDSLGHGVGDGVLQSVARRLESVVRDSDTVSRHSGDEFLVLLAEIARAADTAIIAAKIVNALNEPSHVGDYVLHISASIGIALYPTDGEDALTLIKNADDAMYRSKRGGRNGFEFSHEDALSEEGAVISDEHNQLLIGVDSAPVAVNPDLIAFGPVTPNPATSNPLTDSTPGAASAGELASVAEAQVASNKANPNPPEQALADQFSGLILGLSELREANSQLVIAALTAQELESQAEAAHSRQTRLMATVAHELRNPLSPIRIAAGLLGSARGDETLHQRLQTVIERQVVHLSRLIEDLLDGSRVSNGKLRLDCIRLDLASVLQASMDSCMPAFESRHQYFEFQGPAGPLLVEGDPVRLAQVFSNLFDNSSKYTPQEGHIKMVVKQAGNQWVISVSDDGIGITAEALPTIFDLFVQDARGFELHSGGLGIGLAVVRDLVRSHGGKVVANSAGRARGSEFVVSLPVAPPLAAMTPE